MPMQVNLNFLPCWHCIVWAFISGVILNPVCFLFSGVFGIETAISGKRVYSCYLCGCVFDRPSKLNVHFRIHSGDKPYACNTCGRRFNQKSNLNRHIRTHKHFNHSWVNEHESVEIFVNCLFFFNPLKLKNLAKVYIQIKCLILSIDLDQLCLPLV